MDGKQYIMLRKLFILAHQGYALGVACDTTFAKQLVFRIYKCVTNLMRSMRTFAPTFFYNILFTSEKQAERRIWQSPDFIFGISLFYARSDLYASLKRII